MIRGARCVNAHLTLNVPACLCQNASTKTEHARPMNIADATIPHHAIVLNALPAPLSNRDVASEAVAALLGELVTIRFNVLLKL
jgi:hypothetical protein